MTTLPRLVVLAVAIAILAGCALFGDSTDDDLPTVDDALPVVDLEHPSTRTVRRGTIDASSGRNVDGGEIEVEARINRDLVADEPLTGDELLDWYEERLSADGWRVTWRDERMLNLERLVDQHYHSYSINLSHGDDLAAGFQISYSISL